MRDYKNKMRGKRKNVNFHSKLVAKDRWSKNLEHKRISDVNIFNQGVKWFESGLSLDDASDELKNNFNFVNGFEKAKRVKDINDNLEILGFEWYESGLPIDNAPANYRNNPYFIDGYNKALTKESNKKL